jgi:hypothetical protein
LYFDITPLQNYKNCTTRTTATQSTGQYSTVPRVSTFLYDGRITIFLFKQFALDSILRGSFYSRMTGSRIHNPVLAEYLTYSTQQTNTEYKDSVLHYTRIVQYEYTVL